MENVNENIQVRKFVEVVCKYIGLNPNVVIIQTWQDLFSFAEAAINLKENLMDSLTIEDKLILGFCVRELTANRKGKNIRVPSLKDLGEMTERVYKAYEDLILYSFKYLEYVMNWENPENPTELLLNKHNFENFKFYIRTFLETVPYPREFTNKDIRILRNMTNYPKQEVRKYEGKPHKMRSTVLKAKSAIGCVMHEIRVKESNREEN